MKKKLTKDCLVIAISFFILVLPAYLRFSSLSEIDLFSTDLNFENSDQDDQFDDQRHEPDTFLFNLFPVKSLPGVNFLKDSYKLFSAIPSGAHKIFILRC